MSLASSMAGFASYINGIYRGIFPRRIKEEVYDPSKDVDRIAERVRLCPSGKSLSVLLSPPPTISEGNRLTADLSQAIGRDLYVVIPVNNKRPYRVSISVMS